MQTLTFSRPASNIDSDNYRMNIHRGKYNKDRKYLGSLYLDYSMQDKNDAIFEKCSPQEMIQLKEYVSVFNKMRRCIGATNKSMSNFGLHWGSYFPDVIYAIAEAANKAGIAFLPQDFITDALLEKITEISQQIDLEGIYKKYQFQPDYKKALVGRPHIDKRKRLLQAVINIADEPSCIEQVFNDNLLEQYGKSKPVSYEKLKALADIDNHEKIKIFYLSNCIDTLALYGNNPCDVLEPEIVFEYWLSPRIKFYSASNAIKQFCAEFDIKDQESIDEFIMIATDVYTRPVAVNHVDRISY